MIIINLVDREKSSIYMYMYIQMYVVIFHVGDIAKYKLSVKYY